MFIPEATSTIEAPSFRSGSAFATVKQTPRVEREGPVEILGRRRGERLVLDLPALETMMSSEPFSGLTCAITLSRVSRSTTSA